MRRVVIIFLLSALLICLPISVFAHPGRTDSKGGHYNRSTGEYHYHHGYGEHQHTDMDGDGILDCPYEFEEKEEKNEPPIYINPPPIPEIPEFTNPPYFEQYLKEKELNQFKSSYEDDIVSEYFDNKTWTWRDIPTVCSIVSVFLMYLSIYVFIIDEGFAARLGIFFFKTFIISLFLIVILKIFK